MAKRAASSPDSILGRLAALRQAPSSPEFTAELRRAAAHASPVLVARAAELAARYNRADLANDLAAAFFRFNRGGGTGGGTGAAAADADKQFVARTAVARTLVDLGGSAPAAEDVFLAGAKAVGPSVPPGNPDDFAADLRAASVFGLVNARHRYAMAFCADLLADVSPVARVGAVRALSAGGDPAAAVLLRLRLRVGDRSPDVLAEAATGLMALDPELGIDPAADLLAHADDAVRAAAALAIGTSRHPRALELLRRAFRGEPDEGVRRAVQVAAAGTRSAAATDWLIELVGAAVVPDAVGAVEALGPHRLDETVRARVGEAVRTRAIRQLDEAFRLAFG